MSTEEPYKSAKDALYVRLSKFASESSTREPHTTAKKPHVSHKSRTSAQKSPASVHESPVSLYRSSVQVSLIYARF